MVFQFLANIRDWIFSNICYLIGLIAVRSIIGTKPLTEMNEDDADKIIKSIGCPDEEINERYKDILMRIVKLRNGGDMITPADVNAESNDENTDEYEPL